MKLTHWPLAASVQNYLRWPLTAHIGAILVCNSTPGRHKPAARTHSSHVRIHCSMPNTSLCLPTVHWPSAVLLHLNGTLQLNLLFWIHVALVSRAVSGVWHRVVSIKQLMQRLTELTDRNIKKWFTVNDQRKTTILAPEKRDFADSFCLI